MFKFTSNLHNSMRSIINKHDNYTKSHLELINLKAVPPSLKDMVVNLILVLKFM